MNNSLINIQIDSYRAISSADLMISGITVVAGENGSGKSTLSKLLYYFYKTTSDLDYLLFQSLKEKLEIIQRVLKIIANDLSRSSFERFNWEELNQVNSILNESFLSSENDINRWLDLVDTLKNRYYTQITLGKFPVNSKRRFEFMTHDLRDQFLSKGSEIAEPFGIVKKAIEKIYEEFNRNLKTRPIEFYKHQLQNLYQDGVLPKRFEIHELGDKIFSLDSKSLPIPYTIQNTVYIDTPMIIGVSKYGNDHWDDLEVMLRKDGKIKNQFLSEIISKEILNGDVAFSENDPFVSEFSYKRSDGKVFNLLECATGIKSFAILQLLLKNGTLTDKTLLIIDEPESHLHPQWIIEYARIVVLLHKQVGVKFFIATHNPDFVSALKYISEKEKVKHNLNYYLASRISSEFKFVYEYLGGEIDPIFNSFNIALNRIDEYGR